MVKSTRLVKITRSNTGRLGPKNIQFWFEKPETFLVEFKKWYEKPMNFHLSLVAKLYFFLSLVGTVLSTKILTTMFQTKIFQTKIFQTKIFPPKIFKPKYFEPKCFEPKFFKPKFIDQNSFLQNWSFLPKIVARLVKFYL